MKMSNGGGGGGRVLVIFFGGRMTSTRAMSRGVLVNFLGRVTSRGQCPGGGGVLS